MGGGTMRAASKVAGLASATAVHHHGAMISRRVSSVRAAASATEDVKIVASRPEADVDRANSEVDGWVHVDGETKPMGRVVFGGAPSFREAKEATSELTEALGMAYLWSPNSVGYMGLPASDDQSVSSLSNSPIQNKDCVKSEVAVTPPAVMAFKYLCESPAAQNVVASIACDTNVWNAVLQNPELQDFLKSQRTCSSTEDYTVEVASDCDGSSDILSQVIITEEPEQEESSNPDSSSFQNILQKIKAYVVDVMGNLSGFFQNLFGGSSERVVQSSDGAGKVSGEGFMEASFMGLAVMAILVIVLKRGG